MHLALNSGPKKIRLLWTCWFVNINICIGISLPYGLSNDNIKETVFFVSIRPELPLLIFYIFHHLLKYWRGCIITYDLMPQWKLLSNRTSWVVGDGVNLQVASAALETECQPVKIVSTFWQQVYVRAPYCPCSNKFPLKGDDPLLVNTIRWGRQGETTTLRCLWYLRQTGYLAV